MHAKRFAKLIEAVEKTPNKKFDMASWWSRLDPEGCGTIGCAVGSFCAMNPHAGLKLTRGRYDPEVFSPEFQGARSWDACTKYFEIPSRDTDELFATRSYSNPTKRNVLSRLRSYFKRHAKR